MGRRDWIFILMGGPQVSEPRMTAHLLSAGRSRKPEPGPVSRRVSICQWEIFGAIVTKEGPLSTGLHHSEQFFPDRSS